MMLLLAFLYPLVGLVLCGRAAISLDARERRLLAVGLAFLPLFIPAFFPFLPAEGGFESWPGQLLALAHVFAPAAAAAYLVAWAFQSKDPAWQRIASAAVGVAGLAPLLFLAGGEAGR